MMQRIRALLPALGAIALTIALWAGFTFIRHPVRPTPVCVGAYSMSSAYSNPPRHCTAAYLIRRDPYCLVDPTCASPFLNPHWQSMTGRQLPSFQGAAWVTDYNGPPNTLRMFSVVNYMLFVACFFLLLYGAIRYLGRWRWAAIACACLITWCGLEALRWLAAFWSVGDWYGAGYSTFDWATYAVVALCIMPFVVAVKMVRRARLGPRK